MTLAALVAAFDVEAGSPRAALPLAGATLVEHQIRRLAAAGAERPILLVEQMSPALAAPLARLRADGIAVKLATSIAAAADLLAAEPRVLILADACLPDRALIERAASAAVPTIAVVDDTPENAAFERIDAEHRWAGIALLDGRRIAEVAQMVGDWDPISTMLRSAVQEHAARLPAGRDIPVLAGSAETLRAAELRLVAASREASRGWSDRFVEAPITEALLPQLFARSIQPTLPAVLSAVLAVGGGIAAIGGYRWLALVPLLLAGPLARMGQRLALIQARRLPGAVLLAHARLAGRGLAALGLGWWLMRGDGQWGWVLVAVSLLAAMTGLVAARRIAAWLGGGEDPEWIATPAALGWVMLPFGLAGVWNWGLGALLLYAGGSFAWTLARAWRLAR
jgi:CTP:molybdopterin cytidylyltransferase MocA